MEKSAKVSSAFETAIDVDLFTTMIAGVYLTFDECIQVFPRLSKQIAQYMGPSREFLWKRFYEQEFLRLEYPDQRKKEGESYFEFFKRSFVGGYKLMRRYLTGIVEETNAKTD
jgi:hypothetical protein